MGVTFAVVGGASHFSGRVFRASLMGLRIKESVRSRVRSRRMKKKAKNPKIGVIR
jgi:hypothetical protein